MSIFWADIRHTKGLASSSLHRPCMADPLNGIFMNDSNSFHPSCSINSLHNKNKQKSNLNNSSSHTPIASLSLFSQSFMFYGPISHAQMGVRLAKCDWDRNTLSFTTGAPSLQEALRDCTKLLRPTFKQIQRHIFWQNTITMLHYTETQPCVPQTSPWTRGLATNESLRWGPAHPHRHQHLKKHFCFGILTNVLPLKSRKDTWWGTGVEHMVLK